jgi:CubicO group peptidase (beta-lactamase class C family)
MNAIGVLLDDALAAGLGSAIAVSVGDGGRELFRTARGHARKLPDLGPPIDEHTPFDVASLTKPMVTVACAMVLVADGTLELATPVRYWLPDAAPRLADATVRELLGHAAGCSSHVELFRPLRGARPADPRADLVARAIREPAVEPPATYSDLGYIALGRIIELAAAAPLELAFARLVAGPLGLAAAFAPEPIANGVATEIDDRGLVQGLVHDENAYWGGRICGHAGLFASLDDVAKFAAAMVAPRDRFRPEVVARFFGDAPTPSASWRLGWDTPSTTPGVSHAGDRWPRIGAVGHAGFTGTSIWLDLPNGRWVVLLANRVHPTRFAGSGDAMKALRRAVADAVVEELG